MGRLQNFILGARVDATSPPPYLLHVRSSKLFILTTICVAVFTDVFLYGLIVPVIPFSCVHFLYSLQITMFYLFWNNVYKATADRSYAACQIEQACRKRPSNPGLPSYLHVTALLYLSAAQLQDGMPTDRLAGGCLSSVGC